MCTQRHTFTQVSMHLCMQEVCLVLESPSGLNVGSDSLLFICLSRSSFPSLPSLPSPSLASVSFFLALLLSCLLISLKSIIHGFSPLSQIPPSLSPVSFFSVRRRGKEQCSAAPVAFTCLTAPSRLLSRFLFISLYVCLSISMTVYLPSSPAVPFYILGIFILPLFSTILPWTLNNGA